jgi:hypothetical protein
MSSLIKKLKKTLGVSRSKKSKLPNLHATQIANAIIEQNNFAQTGRVPRLNVRGLEALRTVLLTENNELPIKAETARDSSSNNRSRSSRSSSQKDIIKANQDSSSNNRSRSSRSSSQKDIIKANQDSSSNNRSRSSRSSSQKDEQIIIKYMNGLSINSFVAFTWLIGNLAYLNNNMSLSHYFHIFNITVMIFYTFIQKIESAKKNGSLQNLGVAQLNGDDMIDNANRIMNGGGGKNNKVLSKMIKMIKDSSIHYRNAKITFFLSIFIIVLKKHVEKRIKKERGTSKISMMKKI